MSAVSACRNEPRCVYRVPTLFMYRLANLLHFADTAFSFSGWMALCFEVKLEEEEEEEEEEEKEEEEEDRRKRRRHAHS